MNAHTKIESTKPTGLALLREPFPANLISKLPKPYKKDAQKGRCGECGGWHGLPAAHLDYVGHAALTDRLLDADPEWNWEPMAHNQDGSPAFDQAGGLWIKLTVCGQTRLGYGHADGKRGGDAIKEVIGDALRNAAMRSGAALDLWHKGDLHADESEDGTQASQGDQHKAEKPKNAASNKSASGMPDHAFAKLQQLLAATSTTPDILCGHYKVDHIGQLTEAQFNDAVQVMENQLAEKAKRQSDERASREQRNRKNEFAGADLGDTNF